ncbi:MAG: polysaccharide biosynthesis tyrosine autokinase [Chloroflexi bacterium]|nr:polysaccharide biosynthesis tyrosine autokinase [Chloroflexota bacterium]
MDEQLDPRRYWLVVVRWWWLVVLITTAAAVGSFLFTQTRSPVYEASTTILVQQTGTAPFSTRQSSSDIQASLFLTSTYSRIIPTLPIMEKVAEKLQLNTSPARLRSMVSTTAIPNSQLIIVKVKGTDPVLVRDVANASAETFIEVNRERRLKEIDTLQSKLQEQGIPPQPSLIQDQLNALGSVEIVERAQTPEKPVYPNVQTNVMLAMLLGAFSAFLLAFFLEYLHDTVRTADDVTRVGMVSLGVVPFARASRGNGNQNGGLLSTLKDTSQEAYRLLRTNIDFSFKDKGKKVLLVTSAQPLEGKTTTAVNLAIAIARAGQQVVLVDADLRRPSVHNFFSLSNEQGLSNLLVDSRLPVSTVVQPTDVPGVSLIGSGPHPPNTVELLQSERMAAVLKELKDQFDVVILDSPPVLGLADVVVLSPLCDGALIIVDSDRTRPKTLQLAKESLERGKARVLGVVLNKVDMKRESYYYYYNYYNYYYKGDRGEGEDPKKGMPSLLQAPGRLLGLGRARRRSSEDRQP